jgi:nitroimidazol reductase NimA-like FMN-containing flavoprotein (pyridoxamine 5'-phosphate oxidase superfamily)
MRRTDREVKNFDEIIDILSRCDTLRLGLNGEEYPYVVPLSFGFEAEDGEIIIYVHGAKEGKKHDLIAKDDRVCVEAGIFHQFVAKEGKKHDFIAKDDRVCVEASIFHRFVESPRGGSFTTEYESFIGFGKAVAAEGGEALKGLNLICEHAGFGNFDCGETALNAARVYKIEIEKFTGKRLKV